MPMTPAKSSFMPVCNSPTLLRSRCRTANSRADSVPVIPRRRRLACKSSQYPYYSQSKCITRSALAGIGAEENDGALGRRLEARLAEPAVRHEQIRVAVIVGRGRRMASLLIPIPKLRIRRPGDAPPACTALSSTRSIALSPSTRVISVLPPAEPMSCLVLSVQPVRMPVRDTTPASPSRGRWDSCSLRALGGLTTRERAQRMRAILPGGLNISRWLYFWPWTQFNSGYGVIDFRRAPHPERAALAYRKDTSRAPTRGRNQQAGRLPGPPPRSKEGRVAHGDERYGPGRGSRTGAFARLVQLSNFLQLVRDLDERGTQVVFVVVVDEHVLAVGVVAFARAAAK